MERKKFTQFDWVLIILLFLLGLTHVAGALDKPVHPAEDAAMLMRYSLNLADGNGIVWNTGQPPVDGATDFLFMVLLAVLYTLGVGVEAAPLWVGGISHLITVLLVYTGVRRFFQGGRLAAVLSAIFLIYGSGLLYAEASFGTPFFALFCALSWLFAQYAIEKPDSSARALIFAITCLIMGLIRPEGVLAAIFMLLAVLFKLGWKSSTRVLTAFIGIFLLLGGFYFLWRWNYFGYPLPNPFYKKGGGSLYPESLRESWNAVLELSFPFWLVFAGSFVYTAWAGWAHFVTRRMWWRDTTLFFRGLFEPAGRRQISKIVRILGSVLIVVFVVGLFRRSSDLHNELVFGRYSANYAGLLLACLTTGIIAFFAVRWLPLVEQSRSDNTGRETPTRWNEGQRELLRVTIFSTIPVLGFTLMWILLSNEMNYLWRFQYPILPVVVMTWPLVIDRFWTALEIPKPAIWPIGIRGPVAMAGLFLLIGLAVTQSARWKISYQPDGRYEVAEFLAGYQDKKYTLATTEAGLLPLYSGWQAVDTWGLNDSWIAHNGGITGEYLAKIDPEIIMFHADFSPLNPKEEAGDAWGEMTLMLDDFARSNGYVLAAAYGESPVDTHYYYVRPDFPDSEEIVNFIRDLDDGGYRYGSRTFDFNKLLWKKE